ncbi:MAG: inositol monophosphatase [Alphaproteobacteria bacterium]|nr:inositol monophosphatase [Alphaproteobacteria bacterium]
MLSFKNEDVESIISEVADRIIVPRFKQLPADDVHYKSYNNPVTIADLEAEIELKRRLTELLPGSLVVGEEEFAQNQNVLNNFSSDAPVWTIDPVDGTKLFIAGLPYYGVIVSLSHNDQTLAAWLYDPTSREFITAEKGAGAYYKGERLKVLPACAFEKLHGVMGARLHDDFAQCQTPPDVKKPLFSRMLSSCHDYARLVRGKPHFSGNHEQMHFHCWKETCTPWDNAAGILIHSEAGGFSAHWNEERFRPSHYGRGILTAPNKQSWRELRDWILRFCELPEV